MQALREMRRARRVRRLGDLEWFDIAYRVYLAAIFGGSAVIVVSDLVGDSAVSPRRQAELLETAPGVLGLLAVAALALGFRSGADGGPVAVETADVRHLLLAPVPRRLVLGRPLVQRLRSLGFTGAVVGAIAGQLAAQRLDGTAASWAFGGALAGACIAVLFVSAAVVVHAGGVGRSIATALGAVAVTGQAVAIARDVPGPGDPFGHLAILGWDVGAAGPGDATASAGARGSAVAVALIVPVVLAALAYAAVGRLRLEPLVRRGALVSQLRFAVTVQDLRTVIVLRRQLRSESPRRRPWFRVRRRPSSGRRSVASACWWRGVRGLARTPVARIGRMSALAVATGASVHAVLEGTTPVLVLTGVLAFVLGLDALEPLSQEVDHPSITEGYPVERGRVLLGLLAVPAATIVPFALMAAAVVSVAAPGRTAAALVLAVPLAWVGLAGAAVAVVRDSSSVGRSESALVPPEFAGFSTAMRTVVPVAVSMLAVVPVLALRATPGADATIRSLIGVALVLAATCWWIVRRDEWARRWHDFTSTATTSATATTNASPGSGSAT